MTKKSILITILSIVAIVSILGILRTNIVNESNIISNKTLYVTQSVTDSPKIIAHRGANDRVNEETITAYKVAAQDGVDALEIDLRMTKDGSLIALHDKTIDRTTSGNGEVIDYSLEEIKSIPTIGIHNGQTLSEEIPTLDEIIATFTDTEHYYIETRLVNGELKMEEDLIKLLKENNLISKGLVTIQSFSNQSLSKIHELEPEIPLTLLYSKGEFDLKDAVFSPYPFIGIESTDVTLDVVNELHQNGKEVHVYFIDKETQKNEQERVKAFNVDGYFTDYIEYTKELLQ
ncbi:glycerophosphodiester phosphodiesterase family protein [Psychrobacillus sp. OK032]|uniref:glycerophosphodiester phosphodiesterase n=1 Tax=Psychrobacillus sp. OK032 TaxID=1884358 RepID=UPI0008B36708|nr:glycerophosphodiester phosphodiesterase family protein [Psychrobacillus sp. OK032]SES25316.1 glycerophosphoryl diester phosphodiesterase/2,3-bisphosphoglycerate-dependent phosphoglycerate mutase [Psychrobacillus sp. OK032]